MILLEGLKRALLIVGGGVAVLRGFFETMGGDGYLAAGLILLGLYLVVCGLQGRRAV